MTCEVRIEIYSKQGSSTGGGLYISIAVQDDITIKELLEQVAEKARSLCKKEGWEFINAAVLGISGYQGKQEPEKTEITEFSPSKFTVFVLKDGKMIPLCIEIRQDWISFSALPGKGERGEEEALQLIDAIKNEMAIHRMVIECLTRHVDVDQHRIDRVKVATA